MKRDYIEFQDRSRPLGFLITIRCYGTWLHGDERGSMDRRTFNRFGTPGRPVNPNLRDSDREFLKSPLMRLDATCRRHVEEAIREVCEFRGVGLAAINVRTNHAHSVVRSSKPPEPLMNSFKAYATRRLREHGIVEPTQRVWARHGSTRYLWTEEHVAAAIEYVVNGQGGELPMFD